MKGTQEDDNNIEANYCKHGRIKERMRDEIIASQMSSTFKNKYKKKIIIVPKTP